MRFFIITCLFLSCTQKYQTYHSIDKYNFQKEGENSPIVKNMIPVKKVKRAKCAGQFFFFENAQKKTDLYLSRMLPSLCESSNILLNSRLTETWWTTIIYSRSCVKFETSCSKKVSF